MKPTTVLLHLIKTAAENGVSLGPAILPPPKPTPGPVAAQPPAAPKNTMLPSPSSYMKAPATGRQPGAYGPNGQLLMASGPVRPPLAPKAGPQAAPAAAPAVATKPSPYSPAIQAAARNPIAHGMSAALGLGNIAWDAANGRAPNPGVIPGSLGVLNQIGGAPAAAKAPAARPAPPAKAPSAAPTELERMNSQTNPGQAVADRWKARDAQMARGVAVNPQQPQDNLTTAQLLAPPSPSQAVTQYNPKLRLTPGFEAQRETQAFNDQYRRDRAAAAQPQVASR